MVAELRRTIGTLEQLVARPTGFAGKRLSAVQRTLEQTQAWIAEQEAEIQAEYTYITPGDPDDEWEYDYNASVMRVLVRSRQTVSSLEAERDAITAEQARRQPAPDRSVNQCRPVGDHVTGQHCEHPHRRPHVSALTAAKIVEGR